MPPKAFRFTHFPKNTSANPLESHTFKTKDLKPFRFIHFQKSGGGSPHPATIIILSEPAILARHRRRSRVQTCWDEGSRRSQSREPQSANHESRLFPRLPVETVARTIALPQWTAHPLQTTWPVAHGTSTKSGTPIGKPARQMAATSWYFAYASNM